MTLGSKCTIARGYSEKLERREEKKKFQLYKERQSTDNADHEYFDSESSDSESDISVNSDSENVLEPQRPKSCPVVLDKNIAKKIAMTAVARGVQVVIRFT